MANLALIPAHTPRPEPAIYVLELSAEEMAALLIIQQLIGGDPSTSIRAAMDSIVRSMPNYSRNLQHFWDDSQHPMGVKRLVENDKSSSIIFAENSRNHASFNELVRKLANKTEL